MKRFIKAKSRPPQPSFNGSLAGAVGVVLVCRPGTSRRSQTVAAAKRVGRQSWSRPIHSAIRSICSDQSANQLVPSIFAMFDLLVEPAAKAFATCKATSCLMGTRRNSSNTLGPDPGMAQKGANIPEKAPRLGKSMLAPQLLRANLGYARITGMGLPYVECGRAAVSQRTGGICASRDAILQPNQVSAPFWRQQNNCRASRKLRRQQCRINKKMVPYRVARCSN